MPGTQAIRSLAREASRAAVGNATKRHSSARTFGPSFSLRTAQILDRSGLSVQWYFGLTQRPKPPSVAVGSSQRQNGTSTERPRIPCERRRDLQTFRDASSRKNLISCMLAGLLSALYVGLCAFTPISIYANAALDDQLFLSHGQYLAAGYWLGPYSQTTLAKGPGYPLFLAISSWSGLPITISQGIFKCIAVGALAWVVKRLTGSHILAWAIFILTLWNPGLVLHGMVRETIYPGQTLLLIAILTYALFCASRQRPAVWCGSIAGLVLGWFWLTREEGVWILPAVAILILGALVSTWLRSRNVRLPLTVTLSMLCFFGLTMLTFRCLNFIAYGSFVGVDFQESNFVSAVQALQNVRVGNPVPYLPVPRQVRLKVYRVSPAFASLQKYLDPVGAPIGQSGCRWYPWTCGDIAGGWFLWVLRYAAQAAGHYQSPVTAAQFFREVHDEVTSACQQKLLVCDSQAYGLVPHLTSEQMRQIPQLLWQGLDILLFGSPPPVIEAGSSGNPEQVIADWQFLNRPVRTPMAGTSSLRDEFAKFPTRQQNWLGQPLNQVAKLAPSDSCLGHVDDVSHSVVVAGGAQVTGWAWSPGEKITPDYIALVDAGGTIVGLASGGLDRPDIVGAIGTTGPSTGWQGYAKSAASVSAYAMINGDSAACRLPGIFDVVAVSDTGSEPDPFSDWRVRWAVGTRAFLVHAYRFLMLPLFWVGIFAFPLGALMMGARRAMVDPVFWLATAIWVLVPCRLVLLAIIHVSSFPAMHFLYLSPAYAPITIAPLLSIWSATNQLALRYGRKPRLG